MLMVRDPRPEHAELGDRRHELLERYTTRWSTISGRDGRTIWAEIERDAVLAPEHAPPAVAQATVRAKPTASASADANLRLWSRPAMLALGTIPNFAAPD